MLSGLSSLHSIFLQDNELERFGNESFRGTPNLQIMNARLNELTMIEPSTFDATSNISVIILVDNSLTTIGPTVFAATANLTSLQIAFNQLTTVPVLSTLSRLTTLGMAENRITALEDTTFAGLSALDSLNLQNNQITFAADAAFTPLVALTTLLMSGNPLVVTTRSGLVVEATACNSTRQRFVDDRGANCCTTLNRSATCFQDTVIPSPPCPTAVPPAPTTDLAAEVTRLSALVASLSTCGQGTVRLPNGTCVPDCADLTRRERSCEPACPARRGPAETPGDTGSGGGGGKLTAVLAAAVAAVAVGIAATMLLLRWRRARAKASGPTGRTQATPPSTQSLHWNAAFKRGPGEAGPDVTLNDEHYVETTDGVVLNPVTTTSDVPSGRPALPPANAAGNAAAEPEYATPNPAAATVAGDHGRYHVFKDSTSTAAPYETVAESCASPEYASYDEASTVQPGMGSNANSYATAGALGLPTDPQGGQGRAEAPSYSLFRDAPTASAEPGGDAEHCLSADA
mmetsp:Transcript_32305/g.84525  ORF Transcript_32305/g.84525 Transcript_32305/m.84525 type:complete len:516 (+) Transcript_32305:432-1979(+)